MWEYKHIGTDTRNRLRSIDIKYYLSNFLLKSVTRASSVHNDLIISNYLRLGRYNIVTEFPSNVASCHLAWPILFLTMVMIILIVSQFVFSYMSVVVCLAHMVSFTVM